MSSGSSMFDISFATCFPPIPDLPTSESLRPNTKRAVYSGVCAHIEIDDLPAHIGHLLAIEWPSGRVAECRFRHVGASWPPE